ncbi:hypothetical protein ACFY2M_39310 [Streptomyces sp. NPDC001276]|uniref:hypothetical protein n=1 Tax=Streptomyces sp. NPDC001276 TaxID=3364555 RepID=UPI0036BDF11B
MLALAGCTVTNDAVDSKASDAAPSVSADAPGGEADTGTLPGVPSAEQASTELAGLKVAPHGSMAGYSRAKFPHWAQQGEKCDTREKVLERDGTGVQHDGECRAVSGRWVSVYDDKTFTSASDLDIDHIVSVTATI